MLTCSVSPPSVIVSPRRTRRRCRIGSGVWPAIYATKIHNDVVHRWVPTVLIKPQSAATSCVPGWADTAGVGYAIDQVAELIDSEAYGRASLSCASLHEYRRPRVKPQPGRWPAHADDAPSPAGVVSN